MIVDNLSFSKTKLLLKIFSQKQEDLAIQLEKALEWATIDLGMELGVISHIQHDIYTIKKFWPDSGELKEEQKFPLHNTYCSLAIKDDDVFSISHMAESEYRKHACYENFNLESYIGKPFHLDGTLYGTVNFSSSNPKKNGFSEDEILFVRLLSGWVTSTVHRLKIQNDLREEHKLYKLVSTNSAEMICMHELDGTYTFVSPSVKNLLGYYPHELIGTNPYDIFHPDDLKRIADESHAKSVGGDPDPTIQYRIRKKDGSYIWFDTATQPIMENDEVIALQTTSRDVTERKRLEILFRQSQRMANVGGWEYDLKSGDLFWTDEVYRIHELEIGTKVKVEDGISYYPEGWPRDTLQAALNETMENGETTELELPFRTAKGNLKWVRTIIHAEFEGTTVNKLYGTFQDITKRKRIEEFFRESQEMAKVGGWEFNLDSGDLFWTDEVYRIHELPVGTKVNVENGVSYYPEGFSRNSILAALEHTQKTGEPYDLELPFVTAKGNEIWVRAIGYAELVDGKAVKLKGTFQDITEKKENEEKIRTQLEQLTQLKSTREKLYSIIAHDLRNSIYGITGLLEFLIDEVKADEVDLQDLAEKLSLVQLSADNSFKLLDNMLTWVKLQSGLLNLEPNSFNVQSVLESTINLLRPAIDTKRISLQQKINTDTTIFGERNVVSTVLRNLINNAIKFSEFDSRIDITIKSSNKNHLLISVKDYGIGMSKETLQNLFDSENRPRKDGTMNEKGSGLGLILVKELADLTKCEITASSELGSGSEFIFTVPRDINS